MKKRPVLTGPFWGWGVPLPAGGFGGNRAECERSPPSGKGPASQGAARPYLPAGGASPSARGMANQKVVPAELLSTP